MSKKLPYSKFMKQVIVDLMETGQLAKLIEKWSPKKHACSEQIRKASPLTIQRLGSLFIIILFGITLGSVSLMFEKLLHSGKSKKRCGNAELNFHLIKINNLLKQGDFSTKDPKLIQEAFDVIDKLQSLNECT